MKRDPFDEEAHRRLIARLAAAGDRAGAVRTYRTLAQRLRRELGVAPSALTRELIEQLSVEAPAAVGVSRPPPPGLLALVGRDRQLAELERAWRGVAGGSGAVAVIRGEAGIGKTRLANELGARASASGGRTAACAALDLGGTAPFSLWAELIRELAPSLPAPPADAAWPDELAALCPELPAHFASGGGARAAVAPDLQRTRLFEAVVALLGWAGREMPLLLVLEDAHSADVASLELAGYAARRVAGLPVMMVMLVALSAEAPGSDDLRTYDVGHARALLLMRRGRFIESYGPSIAAGEAIARADRPDLSYGCWVNAASAAAAAGEHERALEFLDRGMTGLAGRGLQSLEIHLLAARSFVLRGLGRLDEARSAAESEQALAEQLAQPELLAMASHDGGVVALQQGRHDLAAALLAESLVQGAPISRPLTRLALAEALARDGKAEQAAEQVRATVLEPVAPSDFPKALVPRLARVQGLVALARDQPEEAQRRIEESIAGWERLADGADRAESITTVLADLGRPVVGLVEPERELARARAELQAIRSSAGKGGLNAVVP